MLFSKKKTVKKDPIQPNGSFPLWQKRRKSLIRTRKRTENSKQKFFASVFAKQKSAYLVVYCFCLQQTLSIPRYKTPWIPSFNVVTDTVPCNCVQIQEKKSILFFFLHAEIWFLCEPKTQFSLSFARASIFSLKLETFFGSKNVLFRWLVGACMCDGFNVCVSTHNVHTPPKIHRTPSCLNIIFGRSAHLIELQNDLFHEYANFYGKQRALCSKNENTAIQSLQLMWFQYTIDNGIKL